jgi:Replication-relaxation
LREKLDWSLKNARATALFLAHTIETAETMIAFELACRERGAITLIDHHDLLSYLPEETREDDAPFHARVAIRAGREPLTIGVIPDRMFSLAFESRTRLNFALELDRGTMDIKARQLAGKSSFRRKLLGYHQLWKEGLHTSRWGFKAFRVLTVTPSEKRIEHMIAVQKEIVGQAGSNLFLFTTPKRLQEKSPLADVWVSGKGQIVSLLA